MPARSGAEDEVVGVVLVCQQHGAGVGLEQFAHLIDEEVHQIVQVAPAEQLLREIEQGGLLMDALDLQGFK